MQIDMHYYGTYAMARAAGLTPQAAKVIATAAQFVDDNAEKESIEFRDGGRLDAEATAHHAFNLKNIDLEDQRKIPLRGTAVCKIFTIHNYLTCIRSFKADNCT